MIIVNWILENQVVRMYSILMYSHPKLHQNTLHPHNLIFQDPVYYYPPNSFSVLQLTLFQDTDTLKF